MGRATVSPAPMQIKSCVITICGTSFVQHQHMKKRGLKPDTSATGQVSGELSLLGHFTRALPASCNFGCHLLKATFFHKLLCTQTPALSWLQQNSPTKAPWQLPGDGQAPWMWVCSHLAPLSKHTVTGQHPCPAMCAAPLQRPLTRSPAPAFLKEQCLQSSLALL